VEEKFSKEMKIMKTNLSRNVKNEKLKKSNKNDNGWYYQQAR
jgi:hypothetical protein